MDKYFILGAGQLNILQHPLCSKAWRGEDRRLRWPTNRGSFVVTSISPACFCPAPLPLLHSGVSLLHAGKKGSRSSLRGKIFHDSLSSYFQIKDCCAGYRREERSNNCVWIAKFINLIVDNSRSLDSVISKANGQRQVKSISANDNCSWRLNIFYRCVSMAAISSSILFIS